MTAEAVREFAPAKVNLCLHVVGRRGDGYHLLDSLVAFAAVGDWVEARPAARLALALSGPEAGGLLDEGDNLVLRAARLMGVSAALTLWKDLPVASGIGGGSADAAATLRALARLTGQPLPEAGPVLGLGADVPVCLAARPARMRGIGEQLLPLPPLPPIWAVLVNPREAVSTAAVFAALSGRGNPPVPDLPPTGWHSAAALADWLRQKTRNDLEAPARGLVPAIDRVLAVLSETGGCLLSRMSGSGATCLGLYAAEPAARAAAEAILGQEPGWWVRATPLHV